MVRSPGTSKASFGAAALSLSVFRAFSASLAPDAANSHAINRLDGVITDVSYLGGLTVYKVKLDSGIVMRSSMANTARLEMNAYLAGQRVVAWFTPDDCMVLEQ